MIGAWIHPYKIPSSVPTKPLRFFTEGLMQLTLFRGVFDALAFLVGLSTRTNKTRTDWGWLQL